MRKTILYLVILAILGFGVYYFLVGSNNNDSPYDMNEAGFKVKDTAAIGKMFIAVGSGESITAERTENGWVVDKRYKALPSMIDLLLGTFATQEPLYPVTKNAYENVIKALSTEGVKVELYGRDGKKMKVFYVGGASVNNTGTNMLMEGAKTPYVVRVPGFSGTLFSRYSTQMRDWRDRTVFEIPANEIKTISVQYAGKPQNSFVITKTDTNFSISADPDIMKLGPLNKNRAKIYSAFFKKVSCEGYLNGLEDMDTTLKTAPRQSTIDVTGIHGQHQHVDVYWMALNRRSKNKTISNDEVPDDYDADRLYAVMNDNKDTVMIQQFVFSHIFHKAYEFFQKDEAPQAPQPINAEPPKIIKHY